MADEKLSETLTVKFLRSEALWVTQRAAHRDITTSKMLRLLIIDLLGAPSAISSHLFAEGGRVDVALCTRLSPSEARRVTELAERYGRSVPSLVRGQVGREP